MSSSTVTITTTTGNSHAEGLLKPLPQGTPAVSVTYRILHVSTPGLLYVQIEHPHSLTGANVLLPSMQIQIPYKQITVSLSCFTALS